MAVSLLGILCSGVALAQGASPDVVLRLDGLAASSEPLALVPGEPLIVEVQLRHPDRKAKEPLLLQPLSGSWARAVKVVVKDAAGKVAEWPFVVTGNPSAGALALRPAAVTTLVLRLDTATGPPPRPGRYTVVARLDLLDGSGFRGSVDSPPWAVEVAIPSMPPAGGVLGRRQLVRVRDALLRGDPVAAEAAAGEMLRAEPRRPEGFIGMALVQAAQGKRALAILSTEAAISLAMRGTAPEPVPLEYQDLLLRLERLPPSPAGKGR